MNRLVLALLLLLSCADLSATVYPQKGPLFDINSPQCAIGRPLGQVLNELMSQTSLLSEPVDTLSVSTSSGAHKSYMVDDIHGSNIAWPTISGNDTLLFVDFNMHRNRPNAGIGDTITLFGVCFSPGTNMNDRKVKALWLDSYYVANADTSGIVGHTDWYNWNQYGTCYIYSAAEKGAPYYLKSRFDEGGLCPKPNQTYFGTNEIQVTEYVTGKGIGAVFNNSNYLNASNAPTRTLNWIGANSFVGRLEYCPIVEDVYDTICRADLPGVYNTKLTESGTDTLATTKTWYGADSTRVLHLVVGEPVYTEMDSVCFSRNVREVTHSTKRKTYVNMFGCDSVVTIHLTTIPIHDKVEHLYETICSSELPGSYNTNLTKTGTDTLQKAKTWTGGDSLVVLHLKVIEPVVTRRDSTRYSSTATEISTWELTEHLTSMNGCDSVVIIRLHTIPARKAIKRKPVVPDKYFSPNGDGIADVWNIKNIDDYQNYVVRIFDRFGNTLMVYNGNFTPWDGTYMGNPLPSSDYWFYISLDETDEELKGHFTLIRK